MVETISWRRSCQAFRSWPTFLAFLLFLVFPPFLAFLAFLALMILPTIALTSRAALAAVPREFINGGAALGLQRWSIAWRISVPAAQSAIGVGVLLALSRALGETMAVLMLAGNVVQLPASVLSPVRTMTANIALEMGYATSGHRATLFASALVLMAVVVGIVLLSRFVGGKRHAI